MQTFDAIIIGSGQAGTPLVFKMAAEGKKVAFVEKQHLGGTCLNVKEDSSLSLLFPFLSYLGVD